MGASTPTADYLRREWITFRSSNSIIVSYAILQNPCAYLAEPSHKRGIFSYQEMVDFARNLTDSQY